MLFETKLTQIL